MRLEGRPSGMLPRKVLRPYIDVVKKMKPSVGSIEPSWVTDIPLAAHKSLPNP